MTHPASTPRARAASGLLTAACLTLALTTGCSADTGSPASAAPTPKTSTPASAAPKAATPAKRLHPAGEAPSHGSVSNHIVYHNPQEFAGWPANEGMWSWGDEVLVGFEVADYQRNEGDHSIDRNSRKRIEFGRSLDGGKTWAAESSPQIGSPEYLGDRSLYDQSQGDNAPRPSPGNFDFSHPDLALKVRGNIFHVSYDRGRNWSPPYLMPEFGYTAEARTSYIITGPQSAVFFITGRIDNAGLRYARSGVLKTEDAGKTFEFLGWIGDDIVDEIPENKRQEYEKPSSIFSIMPSAVEVGENHYVCAVRQRIGKRKWTDIFETTDGGKSWQKISLLEKGSSNPATLIKLKDGRIAAIYGNRKRPFGVTAKLSADNGKTWSDEIVLRDDAREWDIGYSRAILLPDGQVVATYYYTTEQTPENFIAATIWDVDAVTE